MCTATSYISYSLQTLHYGCVSKDNGNGRKSVSSQTYQRTPVFVRWLFRSTDAGTLLYGMGVNTHTLIYFLLVRNVRGGCEINIASGQPSGGDNYADTRENNNMMLTMGYVFVGKGVLACSFVWKRQKSLSYLS